MRRLLGGAILLAGFAAGAGWLASAPQPLPEDVLARVTGDAARGARIFAAAGCASCHTAPEAEWSQTPVLAGGRRFVTDFGTFVAPNISNDETHGIGGWSDLQLANAIQRGIDRDGRHLYPAFPYTTYVRAEPADIADLIAHLRTLPADATPSRPHEVSFPFNIRRGLGLWKRLYLDEAPVVAGLDGPAEAGRYLAEALGHCGECHTARGPLGALDTGRWLGGAPHPVKAEGRIPNVTPGGLSWSEVDIAAYLQSGFTPDFDSAGGEMADVVRNMKVLTDADRANIAAYLKAVPEVARVTMPPNPQ